MIDMLTGAEFDSSYKKWISEVSNRFKASQIKASIKVNDEMLRFYWLLGRDIEMMKKNVSWGSHVYQKISKDLVEELPEIKSFSPRNLQYMNQFYRLYSDVQITHQLDAQIFENQITPQVGAQFDKNIVFMVPWGHHKVIMDKCKDNQKKALFFVQKTLENNWSRAVLLNFLDTKLFDRQGKAVTNFELTLPPAKSDLAQELTKDPYNFDFITLTQNYNEKELKDALMDNITAFLLELGSGFAFVGREYRIEIGNTENFIDMLFYNIKLHCYVVVEVKVTAFEPSFTGQLGTYVVAVNHMLKSDMDAPTLGLLVCKSKDNVQAKYAIESSSTVTIKNHKDINKPNEDYYLSDDEKGIYILVDGVSRDKVDGIYPNPSPSFLVSKIFVKSVYKFLLNNFNENILNLLDKAIKKGNDEIKNYNDKVKWKNDFLPGTVGIIVIIINNKLFYAYIGDCYGIILNGDKHIFSKCQTENITKHKKEFSAFEIRNTICNNENHPYSYGVLNGDIRAMKFVNYGEIDIHESDKILLCSDGFSDTIKNYSAEELYEMDIEQLATSSNDSDDKTMILIERIYD